MLNAFTKEGRTAVQNEAFDFLRTLLNWRKNQEVIHHGKLVHYIPEDNVYVYFRCNDQKKIMVILNGNASEKRLYAARFAQDLAGVQSGREVLTQSEIAELTDITIPGMGAFILELH